MKKNFKNAGAIALMAIFIFSMSSCFRPHVHKWGQWQKSATEHWRVCTASGCTAVVAEERCEHDDNPCTVCGGLKVVAFYTGINDQAHVSFVNEANKWFAATGKTSNFIYESTNDWSNLNNDYLDDCDVVMFLDTRPEEVSQREAFERYMKNGGAWMGFHFSAFALAGSSYTNDWYWYHEEFLGTGQYVSNTWAPTTAVLKVETHEHSATKNLPDTFVASPCEWYRWEYDLRANPDITILASVDESSFPLGTGPKAHEIWHSGYYPIVWSNNNYKMIYMNMGHNLVDYGTPSKDLSQTFNNIIQNQLVLDGLFGFTQLS